jgi:death-on-curing protein
MIAESFLVREALPPFYGQFQPSFLNLDEMLKIHTDQVRRYGGTGGVRDQNLLNSALAQPEASFGGRWLHEDLFEMAAAYTFHLCQNHPFFDGNKRTAFVAGVVFLAMNGVLLLDPKKLGLSVMLSVAEGKLSKNELAKFFRSLPREL